jgi:hypothetical protein
MMIWMVRSIQFFCCFDVNSRFRIWEAIGSQCGRVVQLKMIFQCSIMGVTISQF